MASNYMTQEEAQLRQQLASITVMDRGTEYRLTPEYVHQHMYAAVINTKKNNVILTFYCFTRPAPIKCCCQ